MVRQRCGGDALDDGHRLKPIVPFVEGGKKLWFRQVGTSRRRTTGREAQVRSATTVRAFARREEGVPHGIIAGQSWSEKCVGEERHKP